MDHEVQLVPQEPLVFEVRTDLPDQQEPQEPQEPQDDQELEDLREPWDISVKMAMPVHEDQVVIQDQMDLPDKQDHKELLVLQDQMDQQESQDQPDHKETKDK